MPRFSLLLLASLVITTSIAGCEASDEENCIAGPCGQPPPGEGGGGAGAGAGGAGGAGGGEVCTSTPETGDLPCAVYEALKAKCHTCHTDPTANGAPFPLLTYEDTRGVYDSKQRWEQMGPAITSGFMPLVGAPDLTEEEKQVLLDWLDACARPEAEGAGCECDDAAACP